MRDFVLRIISQWRGDGADQAKRSTQRVGEEARRVNREADQPGRWRRFWSSFADGARRSGFALAGLIRQARTFVGIGLAGVVTVLGRSMLRTAEATQRFAQTAGTTNREAQELTRVAENLNVSVSALESGIRSMNRRVKDMEDDFRAAGIETRTTEGDFRQTRDIFLDLVEVIGGMSSAQERAAAAQRLMGQSGQALLPIMTASREEIEKLMDSTRAMSDQTIERLDALQARWNDFKRTVTVAAAEAGSEVVTTFDSTFTFIEFQIEKAGRSWEGLFRRIRRVAGMEEDLADQAKELGEAEKQISAEKRRQNAEIERWFQRAAEIDRLQAEYKASIEDSRSAAEQLVDIQERIAQLTLKVIANEQGSVDAAREKYELKLREKELQKEISIQEEADRQARQREQDNRESLDAELQILRARAAGDEARAAQLERERDLRQRTLRIVNATGRSEADARRIAAEKLDLESQIADRKQRQRDTERGAAQERQAELTKEERQRRELMDRAVADPFGQGLEGRAAIRELQKMGVLSTNIHAVHRSLIEEQDRRQRERTEGETVPPAPSPAFDSRFQPAPPPIHQERPALPAAGVQRVDTRAIANMGNQVAEALKENQQAVLRALGTVLDQVRQNRGEIATIKSQVQNGRN